MNLLGPPKERKEECEFRVAETLLLLEQFRDLPEADPPSINKIKLERVIKAAKGLRNAIKQLVRGDRFLLHDYETLRELERVIRFAEWRLIDLTGVLPDHNKRRLDRSGGRKSGAGQKLIAAECALDLIEHFGATPATLTKGKLYFDLATKLFELTTGAHEADMEHACRAAFKAAKGRKVIELPEDKNPIAFFRNRTVRQPND